MNILSKQDKSTKALIYANLLPMFGVLFLHWSVTDILYTYWLETVIIGTITVLKMLKAKGIPDLERWTKIDPELKKITPTQITVMRTVCIPFFILHYGGFLSGYIFFINLGLPTLLYWTSPAVITSPQTWGVLVSAAGLFASHWLSYKQNFIAKEEFRKTNFVTLMFAPYKRIFVLHLTILLGVFAIVLTSVGLNAIIGNPEFLVRISQTLVLIIFIILKIAVDKKFHLLEHLKLKQTL